MQRFVFNYYLFLFLILIAQAFFTILTGNQNIQHNQMISKLDLENHMLSQQLDQLQTKVARNRSVVQNQTSELTATLDTAVSPDTTIYLSLDKVQLLAQN